MRILITGGAGFIGSHIQEAYLKAGHEVAVLDSLTGGKKNNLAEGVRFYECDIRSEEAVK
ncbi:MAG: NAD-dependent epimerase/dehydratase family protein, partial [Deltaproteobacteria bacterium]|nr:NAD-dependent epimerase/dehydratase family protein [Deltaproteobacteria bacterium]